MILLLQETTTLAPTWLVLLMGAVVTVLRVAEGALKMGLESVKARRNGGAHEHRRSTDTTTLPLPRGEFARVLGDLQREDDRLDSEIKGLRDWRHAQANEDSKVVSQIHGLETKMVAEFGVLKERLAKAGF